MLFLGQNRTKSVTWYLINLYTKDKIKLSLLTILHHLFGFWIDAKTYFSFLKLHHNSVPFEQESKCLFYVFRFGRKKVIVACLILASFAAFGSVLITSESSTTSKGTNVH